VFELAKQHDLFIKTIMAHVGAISQSATWSISFRNADLNNVRDKSNFALFIFLKIKRATILGLDYLRKKFFVIAVIVQFIYCSRLYKIFINIFNFIFV